MGHYHIFFSTPRQMPYTSPGWGGGGGFQLIGALATFRSEYEDDYEYEF